VFAFGGVFYTYGTMDVLDGMYDGSKWCMMVIVKNIKNREISLTLKEQKRTTKK